MKMTEKLQDGSIASGVWYKNDTMYLIRLIAELKPNSCDNENFSNILYMQVANNLFDLGYSRTYVQCKNKWKELIASYKKYKKSPSGDEPPYFSEIEKVLTNSPDSPDHSKEIFIDKGNKDGILWTQYETSFLLKVMRIGNYVEKLKTEDPVSVYEEISKYLFKIGMFSRSKEEVRQRWKSLKNSYVKYIQGDILHFKYFEAMDALLDWEPNSVAFEEDQFRDGHDGEDNIENHPDDFEAKYMPTTKRSLNWSFAEIEKLLDVVQKYDMKRMKRENLVAVFDEASMQLRLQGNKRSAEQCRVKFKHLKVKYYSVYRKVMEGDTRSVQHFFHFDRMKEILHSSPSETSSDPEFSQDTEEYEVEYLEEEGPELFEQIYLKENVPRSPSPSSPSPSRKGRTVWSQAETKHLLNILKVKKVKRYCRRPVFEEVAYEMEKAGFNRSAQTCMVKWKNLRNQLYTCIRTMQDGKDETCPFYKEIFEIVEKDGAVEFTSDHDPIEIGENENQMEERAEIDEHNMNEGRDLTPEEHIASNTKRKGSVTENDNEETKKFKLIGTDSDNSSHSCKSNCSYRLDDVEHYCLSLSTAFKRLSEKKQAKLRIEIQKLLYKAEFDEDF